MEVVKRTKEGQQIRQSYLSFDKPNEAISSPSIYFYNTLLPTGGVVYRPRKTEVPFRNSKIIFNWTSQILRISLEIY